MDLSLFQFDYRLTWAAFFMNADRVIYGRYGTRADHKSQRGAPESAQNVSLDGMKKALEAALDLHKNYPANKEMLAGNIGPAPKYKAPEEFPSLAKKFKATIEPNGRGCIHCHTVNSAQAKFNPKDDRWLFPYPMPETIGLALDRKERAKIKSVLANSQAEKDGFRAGDELLTLRGQPLLSIADVQWVLHNAKDSGILDAVVLRDGAKVDLRLQLQAGWRKLK